MAVGEPALGVVAAFLGVAQPPVLASGSPNGVERVLAGREQPARCEVLIDDVLQARGGPAMADVAARGEAVGESGEPVSVAGENVSPCHLKRVIGEVSSSSEVAGAFLRPR